MELPEVVPDELPKVVPPKPRKVILHELVLLAGGVIRKLDVREAGVRGLKFALAGRLEIAAHCVLP